MPKITDDGPRPRQDTEEEEAMTSIVVQVRCGCIILQGDPIKTKPFWLTCIDHRDYRVGKLTDFQRDELVHIMQHVERVVDAMDDTERKEAL